MTRMTLGALIALGLSARASLANFDYSTAFGAQPHPWRPKLRNTRTTVAAMKRAAKKRRNVRARSRK